MKARITTSKLIAIGAIGIITGLASLIYFFAQSPASITSEPPVPAKAAVQAAYGKLPLSFEANQGQTDSRVKFLARGNGYTLYLTGDEAVLQLRSEDRKSKLEGRESRDTAQSSTFNPQSSVLRMKLVGANSSPQAAGLDELPGKSNYFIGNDPKKWQTNVPTYAKAKFAEVYPGVDVVYYGAEQQQLEYDFIVAPGADPKAIKLSFEGADKVQMDEKGDLALRLHGKELRLQKPVVYQEKDGARREVAGGYKLAEEREAGFEIAAYDATRPLVIDPVLIYSTFLDGTGQDRGLEIAVNEQGNAFVTGLTTSPTFFYANYERFADDVSLTGFTTVPSLRLLVETQAGEESAVFFTMPSRVVPKTLNNRTDPMPCMTRSRRAGDFSVADGPLAQAQLYDPYNVVDGQRVAFPGNTTPSSRFNPISVRLMQLLPISEPNVAGAIVNNYSYPQTTSSRTNKWTTRLDHHFTGGDNGPDEITEPDQAGQRRATFLVYGKPMELPYTVTKDGKAFLSDDMLLGCASDIETRPPAATVALGQGWPGGVVH
jgi:hypothetical protein